MFLTMPVRSILSALRRGVAALSVLVYLSLSDGPTRVGRMRVRDFTQVRETKEDFEAHERSLDPGLVEETTEYREPAVVHELRVRDFAQSGDDSEGSRASDLTFERSVEIEHTVERQPTTDFPFTERRIVVDGAWTCADVDLTTNWKPNFAAEQQSRLNVYERTPDLKHLPPRIRRAIGRLRDRGQKRFDLSGELAADMFSVPGCRFQTAIRSKIAGASMQGVPDEAGCFVTIDLAAVPELPVWLASGGSHPRMIFAQAKRLLMDVYRELGCAHALREAYFELAKCKPIDLANRKSGQFVKSYAQDRWPAAISLKDHVDSVYIAHIHAVMVLLDHSGRPISKDALADALRKRFPHTRAVAVRSLTWSAKGGPLVLSKAAEAAIRYRLEKNSNPPADEAREQARWQNKLKPDDLFSTGWTSFVNVRPMSVPILRASLLGRHKLREALCDVEIGTGWSPPPAIEVRPSNVVGLPSLRDAADQRVAKPPTAKWVGRNARDGPLKAVA